MKLLILISVLVATCISNASSVPYRFGIPCEVSPNGEIMCSDPFYPSPDDRLTDFRPDPDPLPIDGCQNDLECQEDELNLHCNPMTGRCECFGPTTVEINGTCHLLKLGSACMTSEECDAVIEGSASCNLDIETLKKTCQCSEFSVWDDELSACLQIATKGLESECRRDWQCTAEEALGPQARCSKITGLCECSSVLATEMKNIRFFEGQCIAESTVNSSRNLEKRCKMDQDCEANLGVHVHAICLSNGTCSFKEDPSYTKMSKAQGGFGIDPLSAGIGILATVATVLFLAGVILLLMKWRKHHRYNSVRDREFKI